MIVTLIKITKRNQPIESNESEENEVKEVNASEMEETYSSRISNFGIDEDPFAEDFKEENSLEKCDLLSHCLLANPVKILCYIA